MSVSRGAPRKRTMWLMATLLTWLLVLAGLPAIGLASDGTADVFHDVSEKDAYRYIETHKVKEFLDDCRSDDAARRRWCDPAIVAAYLWSIDLEQRAWQHASISITICGPPAQALLEDKGEILTHVDEYPLSWTGSALVIAFRGLYPCDSK